MLELSGIFAQRFSDICQALANFSDALQKKWQALPLFWQCSPLFWQGLPLFAKRRSKILISSLHIPECFFPFSLLLFVFFAPRIHFALRKSGGLG